VIAQTSNEHLDELNARAQAIRAQHHELGDHAFDVAGRPYRLHAGDEIQIRRSINHPDLGQLRNGTTGHILDSDPHDETLTLGLADGRHVALDRAQIDKADIRLAYVQHPFPAQGQTTDTTHLIFAEHATREGSYVALTRARHRTHIHASLDQLDPEDAQEPVGALARHMSRSEPELPSIYTPLAHEAHLREQQAREGGDRERQAAIGAVPQGILTPAQQLLRAHQGRISAAEHARAVLGPRPQAAGANLAAWERAALTIKRYRTHYNLMPDEPTPLGPEPPPGQFQQRYDRRQAATEILEALNELGRPVGRQRPIEERTPNPPGLSHDELDQGIRWEP
jgi:hypothetical protein